MAATATWDATIALNARLMSLPGDVVPLYRRDRKRMSRAMLRRVYEVLFTFTLPQALYNLPHRVLGLAGDREAAMIMGGLAAFEALPGGVARVVPDAHHAWVGEHPELFTATARAWALDQPLPGALRVR